MTTSITRLDELGFCYGVKRAIRKLEQSAAENTRVDCYGQLVHNPEVMQRLKERGIRVVDSLEEITSPVAAISAHGLSPQAEAELRKSCPSVIDTTCPSVKKVQLAAQRLARDGFTVVVYGDARHIEVKGILGWAEGQGMAALESEQLFKDGVLPHKIGILAQTTQVPEKYLEFVKAVLDKTLTGHSEITVLDTVCEEVRRRQSLSRDLAAQADLMIVVGAQNSANSRRLVEICADRVETHLVEKAGDINPAWLQGKSRIGITSGTSAAEETIEEVVARLKQLAA